MCPNMTRRRFIKNSATGMAAASLSVPLLISADVEKVMAMETQSLNDYFALFGVDEKLISEIIAAGMSMGGDYCDVYFQNKIYNYVGLEDKAVNRAYSDIDLGVGIRVLKGDQTGFSFTEELTREAMLLAAKTAANIANSSKTIAPVEFNLQKTPNYYPIKTSWQDVSIDRKIPLLQTVNDKVFAKDPRIIKSRITFTNEVSKILIATSEGKIAFDYQPLTYMGVYCTAEQDGKKEQNGYNLSGRYGIEFYTPDRIEELATEAVERTVSLFEAVKPEAGEMEVVLAAGGSGILLHEAIGHGMEADFNRKEISIFSDKINKPVAENIVNIVDDGTNPNIRGSINIDDEGNDTEKTFLVQDGVLRSYLHDRISAKYYKVNPTGSGRRQSFRHAPLPRMRNTYMLPGPHKKDEIIGSVKKGLYAKSFTNGQVFIGAGDFTFYVKSGYLIEDGKLTRPVKDVNIIGNGPQVLKDITMVADDFELDRGGWVCGKDGQSVPVSLGLPTVKVSKITVGGVS